MGKLIESTLMTLDGVIEDPATWVGSYLDEEFQNAALARLQQAEAMVMGRATYELLSRDWAGQSGAFADRINDVPKFVFSSRLTEPDWSNARIVRGNAVDEVRRLKEQVPGDLAVYGHGLLSQALLEHGLIDEIRLSVFPVIWGFGKLLFRDGERQTLQLIEATALPTGVVVMRYRAGLTHTV